jgi:8-oxo-dGTP pyrophosphatase MutT (NUDIX family)
LSSIIRRPAISSIIAAYMSKTTLLTEESYGVVPIHKKNSEVRFLLIQHHAGHWAFPKGHAEMDESDKETALREFREETGIKEVDLSEDRVFEESYLKTWRGNARRLVRKTVRYYLGVVGTTTVKVQQAEIQAHRWVTLEEARKLITYNESRKLLEEVAKHLKLV